MTRMQAELIAFNKNNDKNRLYNYAAELGKDGLWVVATYLINMRTKR